MEKRQVSIGLPVLNGGNFLAKRIEQIINMDNSNLELIISDNGSTDNTEEICRKYVEKDKRIRYFRHNQIKNWLWNYEFVLSQANFEYFVWTAVKDIWKPTFLEKNLENLENNKNLVASISKVKAYEEENAMKNTTNSIREKLVDQMRGKFSTYGSHLASGKYDEKVRIYLKSSSAQSLYSVFRTKELQKSCILKPFIGVDLAIILNVLKFGDLFVLDETLLFRHSGGQSSKGIRKSAKLNEHNLISTVFPYLPFTFWISKNLGFKIFVKNIDQIIKMNFAGGLALMYDIFKR